jgi:ATP-dependent helicase HrpB
VPASITLPDLPVIEALPRLRQALADRGRAVLVAPPGAGKTTVVPLALLDETWRGDRRIVMLEPRRLATRAAAERMAALLGTDVGGLVGYQTRDERRIGPATRIEVLTEGVLTRRLQSDPELPGVAAVIFDEIHERNLPTDIGLAFALDSAATLRPDLRLLAMSATVATGRLAAHLGGAGAPAEVVVSEGAPHPIDVRWLPRGRKVRLDDAVVAAVQRALHEDEGDMLVFLPGIGEIFRVRDRLSTSLAGEPIAVHPLAGSVSTADQDAALRPSRAGQRRVVLATDIAETSLTVEGVRIVVDSGLAREPRYDPSTGMTRLTTVSTSRDSADQRAGRAGRLGPGVAYRLWSTVEHGTRAAHRTPEIQQVDLAGLALEVAAWGGSADSLPFLDRPPARALAQATELLTELGALDAGRITDVGRQMVALPTHPRLARMVVADRSSLSCVVAALLDERDVLRGRPDELPVDLALRVRVVAGEMHDRADRSAVARVRATAADIARRAHVSFDTGTLDPDRTGAVLLYAYPERLAGRRRTGQFQLRTGSGAFVDPHDPLADEQFVVAADLDGRKSRARIRLAAALGADDVGAALGSQISETRRLEWDRARDDLVVHVQRRLGGIRLDEQVRRPEPDEATTAALVDRVRRTKLAALGWSQASLALRHRVCFLHRAIGDGWPDWGEEALLTSLDDWLTPYLEGMTGRRDLEALDIGTLLRAQLPWPMGAELDALAPPALDLPGTRRSAPIDYSGDLPVARVRVQDLFGVADHPTVARGRVPVVLELLSPADRPIQVTSDLPGFWAGSWADVRKEMAGRYPKHHWPTDPSTSKS